MKKFFLKIAANSWLEMEKSVWPFIISCHKSKSFVTIKPRFIIWHSFANLLHQKAFKKVNSSIERVSKYSFDNESTKPIELSEEENS